MIPCKCYFCREGMGEIREEDWKFIAVCGNCIEDVEKYGLFHLIIYGKPEEEE